MIRKIQTLGNIHKKILLTSLASAASSFVQRSVRMEKKYDEEYDLAVIGGGSGGLATAFEASRFGLKTIVIDYVEESPQKTKWGLGGTCVNVGCIPKKLMHQAAKHGENLLDAYDYGWQLPNSVNQRSNHEELVKSFSWTKLRGAVMGHIRSLNFGYVSNINKEEGMDYLNAMATFLDKNTLLCSKDPKVIRKFVKDKEVSEQQTTKIKAKNFLIATGTRPNYLSCEGANLAITSDDIFFKKTEPGKTLVVGGGYVAVQIAGFLNGLGYSTSLTTRGEYLRAFDRDMVKEVLFDLEQRKVNIIPTSLPKSLKRINQNQIQVSIQNQITKQIVKQTFNTVLFATGRSATTELLNLDALGVETHSNKKIITKKQQVQRTSVENIYAIGDVVEGLPELTSTAVKMGNALGRRLAYRMKNVEFSNHLMFSDLSNYPTTIFTPLEYSSCGLGEEKAIQTFGRENIEVYHIKYIGLEEELLDKYDDLGNSLKSKIYSKAIVRKDQGHEGKIVGLHFTGPNAGEIMQGFAVAMRMGLTKEILDRTIGIHPTVAENITMMSVTKESGEPFEKTSC